MSSKSVIILALTLRFLIHLNPYVWCKVGTDDDSKENMQVSSTFALRSQKELQFK